MTTIATPGRLNFPWFVASLQTIALAGVLTQSGGVMAATGRAFEPIYSVEGMLTYQATQKTVPSGYSQAWSFKLASDKLGRWQLQVHVKQPNPQFPVESTQHLTYDGTNIYGVVYSPQVVVTRPGSPPKLIPATDKTGAAQITSGPYPVDYGGAVGIIWLAFLGGQYVDSSKERVSFPNLSVGNARGDPMAWACDFQYRFVGDHASKLISSGSFWVSLDRLKSKSYQYPELDEPESDYSYDKFADSLRTYRALKADNRLRSTYVLDQTNMVGGVLVPSRFHIDLLPVDESDAAFHVQGEATNVPPVLVADIMPPLIGLISVQDQRFRYKNAHSWRGNVHYFLEADGWIIDTNDARVKTAVARTPAQPIMTSSNTAVTVKPTAIRLLIIVLMAVPLIIVLRHWQQRHATSKRAN
jgi:hypothetical protein